MDDPSPPKKSCAKRLEEFLNEQPKQSESSAVGPSSMLKVVKKEMAVYDMGGPRPRLLEKLYQALDTIPATSTEG